MDNSMPDPTSNPDPICQALQQTLQLLHANERDKPTHILLIAENHAYFQILEQNCDEFNYQFYPSDAFNQLKFYRQYDIAILILNQQDSRISEQNLQRCRDLFAKHSLVFHAENNPAQPSEFGFQYFCQTPCQISQISKQNFNIYQFNLFDYKRLPDWLNSKFWANPEHWNKFRW